MSTTIISTSASIIKNTSLVHFWPHNIPGRCIIYEQRTPSLSEKWVVGQQLTCVQYSLLNSSQEAGPTTREVQECEVMVWEDRGLERIKAQGSRVQD